MNKSLLVTFGVIVVAVAGIWFWSMRQNDVVYQPPTTQPPVGVPATHVYTDTSIGFSITLPTALSSTTNDSLYRVDASYAYTAMGPGKSIGGVKFTIPGAMASGTNLSKDTYVSVEHLTQGQICTVSSFIEVPNPTSHIIREGALVYSFASSSGAAAGNRYEEYVYALSDSNPCIAVRYFVHYGAIENYDQDTVKAFNRTKLFADFDAIRRTLFVR